MAEVVGKEKSVSDATSELHHYTRLAGLEGIIKTQSLWASNYKTMNDGKEWHQARNLLRAQLPPLIKRNLLALCRSDKTIANNVQQAGGINHVTFKSTDEWITMLYQSTEAAVLLKEIKFASPYITSFCCHADDMPYEQENGLLSQWRGYGGDSSYAIVFDAKGLEDLCNAELAVHQPLHFYFSDVKYERNTEETAAFFMPHIEKLADCFKNFIQDRKPTVSEMDAFLSIASRVKHPGFFEEREYRIVYYPVHDSYLEYEAAISNSRKRVTTSRQEVQKPWSHVVLFEGLGIELPIRRIIVGPSEKQDADIEAAKRIVGDRKVPVVPSMTPLVKRR